MSDALVVLLVLSCAALVGLVGIYFGNRYIDRKLRADLGRIDPDQPIDIRKPIQGKITGAQVFEVASEAEADAIVKRLSSGNHRRRPSEPEDVAVKAVLMVAAILGIIGVMFLYACTAHAQGQAIGDAVVCYVRPAEA